ncbi:hypothetical protein ACIOD2_11070 [Amycolatopsis sp. NPDC088138]|uniref:hypothetical protein n=1 Tax=Amycolatopsis sp. NPDC088138 TaxID=3363938 RepID=UPI003805A107
MDDGRERPDTGFRGRCRVVGRVLLAASTEFGTALAGQPPFAGPPCHGHWAEEDIHDHEDEGSGTI